MLRWFFPSVRARSPKTGPELVVIGTGMPEDRSNVNPVAVELNGNDDRLLLIKLPRALMVRSLAATLLGKKWSLCGPGEPPTESSNTSEKIPSSDVSRSWACDSEAPSPAISISVQTTVIIVRIMIIDSLLRFLL